MLISTCRFKIKDCHGDGLLHLRVATVSARPLGASRGRNGRRRARRGVCVPPGAARLCARRPRRAAPARRGLRQRPAGARPRRLERPDRPTRRDLRLASVIWWLTEGRMAKRLHVGTRKGLFELARDSGSWEIVDVRFLGDPVSAVLADADGSVWAALDLGHFGAKVWARDSAGAWRELAVPVFPPKPDD